MELTVQSKSTRKCSFAFLDDPFSAWINGMIIEDELQQLESKKKDEIKKIINKMIALGDFLEKMQAKKCKLIHPKFNFPVIQIARAKDTGNIYFDILAHQFSPQESIPLFSAETIIKLLQLPVKVFELLVEIIESENIFYDQVADCQIVKEEEEINAFNSIFLTTTE
ncbi:MAG: hypothetical protein ABIG60_01610 [Patescibacteria group bacterium]